MRKDDLVGRLRLGLDEGFSGYILDEAADRIEELEAELKSLMPLPEPPTQEKE